MADILDHTEAELRKRLDLSSARNTRTDKVPVILCRGKRGNQSVERCLTIHRDGWWELTGAPARGDDVRILINGHPVQEAGPPPETTLRTMSAMLRQAIDSRGLE